MHSFQVIVELFFLLLFLLLIPVKMLITGNPGEAILSHGQCEKIGRAAEMLPLRAHLEPVLKVIPPLVRVVHKKTGHYLGQRPNGARMVAWPQKPRKIIT
jgi:hypothetical protein